MGKWKSTNVMGRKYSSVIPHILVSVQTGQLHY